MKYHLHYLEYDGYPQGMWKTLSFKSRRERKEYYDKHIKPLGYRFEIDESE